MFKRSFDVPANTTATAPSWEKLKICKGKIIGWIVFMPEEAADLLQLRVQYHHEQIFPFTGSTWFYGNFQPFLIPDEIPVSIAPYVLDIYAVNTDDTFSHEYNVMVIVEPETAAVGEVQPTTNWFSKLRDMFGGE